MEIGRNRVLPLLYLTARAFLGGYTVALLGNIVGAKVCTCKRKHRRFQRTYGAYSGGALSAAVEPLSRHIVAAVRALQTEKRRHFGTLQPLFVCFFQLVFVQGNAVQQITLILGGCIVIDAEPFADCAELVKHFNSSRGHSFDFNIHENFFA